MLNGNIRVCLSSSFSTTLLICSPLFLSNLHCLIFFVSPSITFTDASESCAILLAWISLLLSVWIGIRHICHYLFKIGTKMDSTKAVGGSEQIRATMTMLILACLTSLNRSIGSPVITPNNQHNTQVSFLSPPSNSPSTVPFHFTRLRSSITPHPPYFLPP